MDGLHDLAIEGHLIAVATLFDVADAAGQIQPTHAHFAALYGLQNFVDPVDLGHWFQHRFHRAGTTLTLLRGGVLWA